MTWEVKKLGEITTKIGSGATPRGGQKSYKTEGISLIRSMNVHDRYFKEKNLAFIDDEQANDLSNVTLQANDVLLNITGASIARCCIVPDKYLPARVNQHVSIIRPNPEIMDSSFLNLLLTSKYYKDQLLFTGEQGSTRQAITKVQLQDFIIHYPPLTEQKRIVAILDEAFESIARAKESAEKNLKNAIEIFESYLQSVFENKGEGWEAYNLEDHIKLIDYRWRTPVKTESVVRLITAKNVKLGYLQLEPQEFIDENNYDSWMTRGIPNFGDVIFTTEAPLANVAQINTTEKLAFAQRIIVMQPQTDKIDQTFLKYMLVSKPIRTKILEKGTGATVQGIKSKLLKKIKIYVPKTITEQKRIVTKLDALSAETKKLEAIYTQKLADLEELKKSILQKAFNGELTEVSI
jgi:type I restriction enzyme S subunit